MKRKVIFFIAILIFTGISAQENKISDNIDFNGYIQIRGISNFDDYTTFSVRRLKLWIKSKPGFSKHWSYKVQTTFSSFHQEKFFLQDVKIGYQSGLFSFDIGQFVPNYSLQRLQPDYKLPAIERAKVINILIPDGTLGVRDIGVQANFQSKNKIIETHLGIFNGYGIKEYRFSNNGYMITNKSELEIPIKNNKIKLGYSFQYRYAENLQLKYIFPDTVTFTGNDFRYNLFARFKSKYFDIQGELLNANFNGQKANGYYILSTINYKKNQIVLSIENYNDLINATIDKPFYRIGYNYLIKEYNIKLSFDNYFQIIQSNIEKYYASLQLQMFIN